MWCGWRDGCWKAERGAWDGLQASGLVSVSGGGGGVLNRSTPTGSEDSFYSH